MQKSKVNWASTGQLALSLIGITFQLALASLILFLGATQLITVGASESILYRFMLGTSWAAVASLMIPSAYYSLMKILGKEPVDSKPLIKKLRPERWILALPPVLLMGYFVAKTPEITWLLLPPLQVLAIGIPSFWLIYLAIKNLPTGSSQRVWGVLNAGLFLAPALIIFFELVAGFAFFIIGIAYLYANPTMVEKITALAVQLRGFGSQDEILKILGPLLVHPLVVLVVLVFAAVAVPLIEELIKPIGVWLLAGRKISPAAGFAAGALSGGGYGLVESLMFNSSSQDWTTIVLARNGTTAIHILTSALMGWAIVQVWQKKRIFRLGLVYLTAVLIHGSWNGLTVIYSLQSLAAMENLTIRLPLIDQVGSIAIYLLVLIAAGCFSGLIFANRFLERNSVRGEKRQNDQPRVEGTIQGTND